MSKYTLSINIMSDNRELLDSLLITLESVKGNLSEIDRVLLINSDTELQHPDGKGPTTLQRNLFLDKWILPESG